jgi:hypothetical protein
MGSLFRSSETGGEVARRRGLSLSLSLGEGSTMDQKRVWRVVVNGYVVGKGVKGWYSGGGTGGRQVN